MLFALAYLSTDGAHLWRMLGPLNTGHEKQACNECHEQATGSFRQQIQANISYLMGKRKELVALNLSSADNKDCLACMLELVAAENNKVRKLRIKQIVVKGKKAGLIFGEDWRKDGVDKGALPAIFLRETASFKPVFRLRLSR